MQEYCIDSDSCRRKLFYEKFTEQVHGFKRCGNICDNCRSLHGQPRRSFIAKAAETTGKRYGGSRQELIEEEKDTVTALYPALSFETSAGKSRFFSASEMIKTAAPTANPKVLHKPIFATASGKLVKMKSTGSNEIIDLCNDDENDWITPHPKRLKSHQTL